MSRFQGQTLFNWHRALFCRRKFSNDAPVPNGHRHETKLMKQIKAKILTSGPITVADYMKEVLTNPSAGYYMNRDVFGEKGDFTTSPEISQVFGELVGIWFLNEWEKCGRPKPLQITELGPGRGTLMHDILRVFSKFRVAKAADLSVSLVEVSPHLSNVQETKLCRTLLNDEAKGSMPSGANHYKEAPSLFGTTVRWYRHLSDTPKSFTLYLAHEFFDALPVHKLVKKENEWREVLIDLDTSRSGLRYVLSRSRTPACLFPKEDEQRTELEISPQSLVTVQHMAQRIHEDGGIGLIVDYGHEGEKTDTFRAFRDHKLHDPLVEPGTADLTADVDFSSLKWAATNPSSDWKANLTYGTVTQRDFLMKMGMEVRLQALLAACKDEKVANDLRTAHQMLLDPQEMGGKFRFLALFPAVMERILQRYPPCGFS